MKVHPSCPTLITTGKTLPDDGVLDLERIILEEVVLQPDDDAIHDRRGSFGTHKLHMLYILAFYRATLMLMRRKNDVSW